MNIKYTLSIFIGIYLSLGYFFGSVGAANECSACRIKDEASPGLENYFSDIQTIVGNIGQSLNSTEKTQEKRTSESIRTQRKRVVGSLNNLLNFGEYVCSFDYNISLLKTNEIPSQVQRDYTRIKNITEMLTSRLENAEIRGTAGLEVKNVCNGVRNCDITDSQSGRDILTLLIKNNNLILQHFYGAILEKDCASNDEIILVAPDFLGELSRYYNKDTLTACSSCKEEFIGRIQEEIQNISFLNSDYKKGVQAWKEAWAMLKGGFVPEGDPEAREAKQGESLRIDGRNMSLMEITNSNREKYGNGGLSSTDTNLNEEDNALFQIRTNIEEFREALRQEFNGKDRISITRVPNTSVKIETTQVVGQTISELYESLLPSSLVQDTSTQEVQLRMIRMHMSLTRSINLLETYIPKSEKVCDRQGTGMGQCKYE